MRRGLKRSSASLALLAFGLGCAAAPAPPADSVPRARAERRAPGVTASPPFAQPRLVRAGDSRQQWLWLRAPASTETARTAVRDFLRAAVNEAPEQLSALLTPQAYVDTQAGRLPARAFWQARLSQLDYTELRGQVLFREAELETFRAEDLLRVPAARRPTLPLDSGEVAVRVTLHVSWAGRTRLFGDELLFRLQPAGARFAIAEISEDFHLP